MNIEASITNLAEASKIHSDALNKHISTIKELKNQINDLAIRIERLERERR